MREIQEWSMNSLVYQVLKHNLSSANQPSKQSKWMSSWPSLKMYSKGGHKRQAAGKPHGLGFNELFLGELQDKNAERQVQEEGFVWHSRTAGVGNKQSDARLEVLCASLLTLPEGLHTYISSSPLPWPSAAWLKPGAAGRLVRMFCY